MAMASMLAMQKVSDHARNEGFTITSMPGVIVLTKGGGLREGVVCERERVLRGCVVSATKGSPSRRFLDKGG